MSFHFIGRRKALKLPKKDTGAEGCPLVVLAGGGSPLGGEVANYLGSQIIEAKTKASANGELSIQIPAVANLRDKDVFIVQSTAVKPNDSLMELMMMADAARRSGTTRLTAVIPCMGYCRSDKKEKGRTPVSAKLVANLLEVSGVMRVITLDLHSHQIQAFFNIPVDNLLCYSFLLRWIRMNVKSPCVIVSPNVGGVAFAKRISDGLDCPLAIAHYGELHASPSVETPHQNEVNIVGNVDGRVAVIIEDVEDNCEALTFVATALIEQGATEVLVCCSHGLLTGPGLENLENSSISKLVMTNSVPVLPAARRSKKVEILDISHFIAEAIRRVHNGESLSPLFTAECADRFLMANDEDE